jgi:hypothetical protein
MWINECCTRCCLYTVLWWSWAKSCKCNNALTLRSNSRVYWLAPCNTCTDEILLYHSNFKWLGFIPTDKYFSEISISLERQPFLHSARSCKIFARCLTFLSSVEQLVQIGYPRLRSNLSVQFLTRQLMKPFAAIISLRPFLRISWKNN